MFAGTNLYGVYKSNNGGTTWTQTFLNDKTVYSLAISGNLVYAGTNLYGLYVSTDNGVSWDRNLLN